MTDFSEFSLTGCLVDESYSGAPMLSVEDIASPGDAISAATAGRLPPRIDLRKYCSPMENQLSTQSCVANAVVGALELLQKKSAHSVHDLSRLFLYYNTRLLQGTQDQDSGSYVHLAMASLIASGICEERMWPFSLATVNDPPTQACYENAQHYRGVEFAQMQPGTPILPVLAQEIPVVIAVELPRAAYIEAHKTGTMRISEGAQVTGGFAHGRHAMVLVGYDIEKKAYLVRNSWGEQFADKGYFYMPFSILDSSAMAGQQWAIGALNRAPGLRLLGASVEQSVQGMIAASPQPGASAAAGNDALGKQLRGEIEGKLDAAKKGFASRLRGG